MLDYTWQETQHKLPVWVPHGLSEKNLMDRISICSSDLARYKIEPFLNLLVTGDEKWIVYKYVVRKEARVYKEFCSETLPQPAYTSGIAPFDYHLFKSLQNFVAGKEYIIYEDVQMAVEEYFVSTTEIFFTLELDKLPKHFRQLKTNMQHDILD
ncbi:mariner Mos1 transposase [Trichonephila clavipes]|nr:mariner Mos1 transposase [Trichonephila clavipes]